MTTNDEQTYIPSDANLHTTPGDDGQTLTSANDEQLREQLEKISFAYKLDDSLWAFEPRELLSLIDAHTAAAVEEALTSVSNTELPWPKDVFGEIPKEDYKKLDDFAKTLGYRMDTIGATLMRRGWKCLQRVINEEISERRVSL